MKPAAFAYDRPTSLPELLTLLDEHRDECKILAGGQSLVAAMNFRLARPARLIDINNIAELDVLAVDGERLRIGALTRHARFHRPVVEGPLGLLLRDVAKHIAHYPIRQRGTFAGSLSHADPASEWCLVATTLEAEFVIHGPDGIRTEPAATFFRGTFTTSLRPNEVLAEVRLPILAADWRWGFREFSRRKGDFALAMALCAVRIEGGVIRDAKLGVGGVADRALRLATAEDHLKGQVPSDALFAEVAFRAAEMLRPSSDIHGSSAYRKDLAGTMIRRALAAASAGEPRASEAV
jgi:carbon-monoxide dehydrogenase medium subunit